MPGHCFCSHDWITPRQTTRSSTPWAGHLNSLNANGRERAGRCIRSDQPRQSLRPNTRP
jgi:hypothetical protein